MDCFVRLKAWNGTVSFRFKSCCEKTKTRCVIICYLLLYISVQCVTADTPQTPSFSVQNFRTTWAGWYQNVKPFWHFIAARDVGNGNGANWNSFTCKAWVISPLPTAFRLFAGCMPLLLPNHRSNHWRHLWYMMHVIFLVISCKQRATCTNYMSYEWDVLDADL